MVILVATSASDCHVYWIEAFWMGKQSLFHSAKKNVKLWIEGNQSATSRTINVSSLFLADYTEALAHGVFPPARFLGLFASGFFAFFRLLGFDEFTAILGCSSISSSAGLWLAGALTVLKWGPRPLSYTVIFSILFCRKGKSNDNTLTIIKLASEIPTAFLWFYFVLACSLQNFTRWSPALWKQLSCSGKEHNRSPLKSARQRKYPAAPRRESGFMRRSPYPVIFYLQN